MRLKSLSAILTAALLLTAGCATTTSMRPVAASGVAIESLKNNIRLNQSRKSDVTALLGEPEIRSVDEGSSLDLSKIPFFNGGEVIGGVVPHETWTYIYGRGAPGEGGRTIKVMGVSVFGKDIKTLTVVFNREGRVLGYQMVGHYVK